MPSHSNQDNINFLYVSQVQGRKKRRRPSFWGCRSRKPSSSARDRHPGDKPAEPVEPSSRSEAAQATSPSPPARQAHHSPTPPSQNSLAVEYHNMDRPSPIIQQQYYTPPPHSSAQACSPYTAPPVMQPFRTLVASVKRCPWAPISDVGIRGQPVFDDVYYPPVPRSLLHDTAVSFLVKDYTRPDLPEFVISCPFENVDLVHQLLAPDGSRRQLTARGTSGQPRNADRLRSMLLDGTPSIELALHADPGEGVRLSRNRPSHGSGDDGGAGARRPRFVDGVVTPRRDNSNARGQCNSFNQGIGNGEVSNGRGQHTSLMDGPTGRKEAPVATHPGDLLDSVEPEVENPRTNGALASPLWSATPLQAPPTPASSLTPSPDSEHSGSGLRYMTPSPLHFQATVESAPPTPSTGPMKVEQDDPAPVSLVEGREEGGDGDEMGQSGGREQDGPGSVGEPPALVYVQPSPGQLERGVPLTGWLCDPEWLRRSFRDFTLGNTQGR